MAQEDAPGLLAMVPDSRDVPAESTLLSLRLPGPARFSISVPAPDWRCADGCGGSGPGRRDLIGRSELEEWVALSLRRVLLDRLIDAQPQLP